MHHISGRYDNFKILRSFLPGISGHRVSQRGHQSDPIEGCPEEVMRLVLEDGHSSREARSLATEASRHLRFV